MHENSYCLTIWASDVYSNDVIIYVVPCIVTLFNSNFRTVSHVPNFAAVPGLCMFGMP